MLLCNSHFLFLTLSLPFNPSSVCLFFCFLFFSAMDSVRNAYKRIINAYKCVLKPERAHFHIICICWIHGSLFVCVCACIIYATIYHFVSHLLWHVCIVYTYTDGTARHHHHIYGCRERYIYLVGFKWQRQQQRAFFLSFMKFRGSIYMKCLFVHTYWIFCKTDISFYTRVSYICNAIHTEYINI